MALQSCICPAEREENPQEAGSGDLQGWECSWIWVWCLVCLGILCESLEMGRERQTWAHECLFSPKVWVLWKDLAKTEVWFMVMCCAAAGEVFHPVTSFFWLTQEDKGKEPIFLSARNRWNIRRGTVWLSLLTGTAAVPSLQAALVWGRRAAPKNRCGEEQLWGRASTATGWAVCAAGLTAPSPSCWTLHLSAELTTPTALLEEWNNSLLPWEGRGAACPSAIKWAASKDAREGFSSPFVCVFLAALLSRSAVQAEMQSHHRCFRLHIW